MTTFSGANITTVQYQILFVKRCYECMLRDANIVVTENMDATGFISWRIADFVQQMNPNGVPIPQSAALRLAHLNGVTLDPPPGKWNNGQPPPGVKMKSLGNENTQYLRVEFQVLSTVARAERDTCEPALVQVSPIPLPTKPTT